MQRVLLKVHQVELRLREEVEIQIVIKKGNQSYNIPRKAKLSKGKSLFGAHAQFFVASKDPTFDLNVNIIHGSAKRFAGMCQVDLKEWEQNSNNSIISLLQKSPDNKAKIMFDFIFMSSDLIKPNRGLISQTQLQAERRIELAKSTEEKIAILTNENKRLMQEIMTMKKKNKDLAQNQKQLAEEYVKKSLQQQGASLLKYKEIKALGNKLRLMRQKLMKLEAIICHCEEPKIKQRMLALQSQLTRAT